MKRVCFVITIGIALLLVRSSLSHAGAARAAAQFLTLGGGPRAEAMGDAFANMSGDITCIFSNPSGLSDMEELQGAYAYKDHLYGSHHRFAVGGPVDLGLLNRPLGVVGGGFQKLYTDWAFTASYADKYTHQLSKNKSMGISMGLSGKIIHWDSVAKSFTKEGWEYVGANAYALDLGLLYDVLNIYINESTTKLNEPNFRFRIGAVLQNLGTKIQFAEDSEPYSLPRRLRVGALVSANLRARDLFPAEQSIPMNISLLRLNIAGEFTKLLVGEEEREGYLNPKSVGMEMWMLDILAVRLGYKSKFGYKSKSYSYYNGDLTFGFGLRIPLASIIAFAMPQSSEANLIDKLYRQTDRQMFLQLDFARIPGGGPRNEKLTTFALSGGF